MYQTPISKPRDGLLRRLWQRFVTFAQAVDLSPDEIHARRLSRLESAVRNLQARMPQGD